MKNKILEQSLDLSEEILSNIELDNVSLLNITLKTLRLSRFLNDFEMQKVFQYELSGYPTSSNGIKKEIFALMKKVDRTYSKQDSEGTISEHGRTDSIEKYVTKIESGKQELLATNEILKALSSNTGAIYSEKATARGRIDNIQRNISLNTELLSSRRIFIYNYVLEKNYELKYSNLNSDIFTRTQLKFDSAMMDTLPETIKKFTSVYSNLLSENNEDWSNAVHSCRRILQDLADEIYPARESKELPNGKKINLGVEQYINRLIAYIEEHSESSRFQEIVGSNISYIGERLDSIFNAVQKGSHKVISTQDEADRYVIYTYLIVGDILRLKADVESKIAK